MASRFAERIHFAHLRSTQRDALANSHAADHLADDVDMWGGCCARTDQSVDATSIQTTSPSAHRYIS